MLTHIASNMVYSMIRKVVWVLPLVFAAGQLSSQQLYRYVDQDGITILNSSIPAEYVNSGYEVINSSGQVVQTVLPQKGESAEPELVVDRSDTILMSSYSNVVEIESRRDRKVDSIEREIENILSDRRVLGLQLDKEIAERDRIFALREKQEIPQRMVDDLVAIEAHINQMTDIASRLDAQLASRQQDISAIEKEFAVKVERFIQLEQAEVDVRHTSVQPAE